MINIRDKISIIQNGTGISKVIPLDDLIGFIKRQVISDMLQQEIEIVALPKEVEKVDDGQPKPEKRTRTRKATSRRPAKA